MADQNIALMAHLMRRAGFGAGREELEARAAKGYEATVEELVNPKEEPIDQYRFVRHHPEFIRTVTLPGMGGANWLHTMIATKRPLEEKMVLFWHQIFATGISKVDHYNVMNAQLTMFRENAMGNYRDFLVALAKDPAMIYWLDNNENHAEAVNENWGRELLELFSMGVGNYTEDDVRECSRAFTGWTIAKTPPRAYGRYDWVFEFLESDHDDGEKTFLGHTGNFDGEDVIGIICQQPATARFVARHLYNFFVADEPQVPSWSVTPPKDPEAIEILAKAFGDSGYELKPVLSVLFNSEFFKNARFAKIKSPIEAVVGAVRFAGGAEFPAPGIGNLARQSGYMGQELLNPPSVEGWHTGVEWVNSGALMKRINFTAGVLGDIERPGIQTIIGKLQAEGDLAPEDFVNTCLDLAGPLEVKPATHRELIEHASEKGDLSWNSNQAANASTARVGEMLKLIASVREFQYS